MDDLLRMEVGDGRENLLHDVRRHVLGKLVQLLQPFEQLAAAAVSRNKGKIGRDLVARANFLKKTQILQKTQIMRKTQILQKTQILRKTQIMRKTQKPQKPQIPSETHSVIR